ncbi:hypothetical protein F53441_4996 [Fusarium austroafricanum]|uniref:AMP-dependent synthetase/ligase domain-containing protein n=1 Tax=Fusarium austroafricanum TaxID=2364996 RepID=A0A8H4KIT8_9HYPO|nr:hypothetical protein F53441_4996 [Fusarium austroafricanum]
MVYFKTPVSELEEKALKHLNLAVFKIAQQSPDGTQFKDVSFLQFEKDVQLAARYWKDQFSKLGVKDRAVIGVWLKGYAYSDAVHIFGLMWAGYIPQTISLRMTDPTVIYELLKESKAAAMLHELDDSERLQNSPLSTFPVDGIPTGEYIEQLPFVAAWKPTNAEDVIHIAHTSGSVSGRPKLVPGTARWVDHIIGHSAEYSLRSNVSRDRMISLQIGSFCHMAASFLTWFAIREGSCIIIPSTFPAPIHEIHQMIDEHGLSNVTTFPPMLSALFREARKNPSLLASLKKIDGTGSGGLDPVLEDYAWARSHGIPMLNVFGSTELGLPMMTDARDNSDYLKPLPGTKYEYVPIGATLESGEQLLELVVPPDSPNCPVPSLRSADGKFHTGDLFIEPESGKYLCKGRNDNWIKMQNAYRCDTSSIEANVMETCGDDLVNAVVVVGAERPCPTIIVEAKDKTVLSLEGIGGEDAVKLKEEILRRITPFHQRRYTHERIDDTRYILVVPQGTLPRTATKGNVRRQEVEKGFKTVLDELYVK